MQSSTANHYHKEKGSDWTGYDEIRLLRVMRHTLAKPDSFGRTITTSHKT